MKMQLENGKILEIKALKVSDKNRYVESVTLNGKLYENLFITHDEIAEGGVIEFEMTSKPNTKRGITETLFII